ncbi:MAG: helix-turn-helix transcriptional regulator [Oscillospiraceae bacterium]|nr:helix-turn-helix transcriptional regulator [Oscillospiraceae bacterium]
MTFAEKLKTARKTAGMSQEALSEKLGVSRQAVTKWETGRGIPDVDNMMVISNLFGISVDEFLSHEKEAIVRKGYLFESRTDYDIDGWKHFDFKLGGAHILKLKGVDGEKIGVRLASNELEGIGNDFKVKIDDIKNWADVEIKRQNKMTQAIAKEHLIIELLVPRRFVSDMEIEINCGEVEICGVVCDRIDFKGKIGKLSIDSMEGFVTVESNLDMDISLGNYSGTFGLNQVSATSRLIVPADYKFRTIVKGIGNSVSYESEGVECKDFSSNRSENAIEFNGLKSELVITR